MNWGPTLLEGPYNEDLFATIVLTTYTNSAFFTPFVTLKPRFVNMLSTLLL
jgi:hypothetical protein